MLKPPSTPTPASTPTLASTVTRTAIGPPELRSEALFNGRQELLIRHGDELYRLRLTRMNKLILTK